MLPLVLGLGLVKTDPGDERELAPVVALKAPMPTRARRSSTRAIMTARSFPVGRAAPPSFLGRVLRHYRHLASRVHGIIPSRPPPSWHRGQARGLEHLLVLRPCGG